MNALFIYWIQFKIDKYEINQQWTHEKEFIVIMLSSSLL